jgi:release factor glutamine methyltransferase
MPAADLPRPTVVAILRAAGCVYAEDEADVLLASAGSPTELRAMLTLRESGVPLEHVVGWAELCGVRVAIDRGVFVPRRRSALLARQALSLVPQSDARPVIVDLCCGSGAVGAVIVSAQPQVELHAVDIDAAAVDCARRNLVGYDVHLGDLFEPLPARLRGSVHVVVANAPYVPTSDLRLLPRDVRDHEPTTSLDGGADGLDVQRRVALGAVEWLAPDGCVLVETSSEQAVGSVAAMVAAGLDATLVMSPDDDATVVIGRRV